MERKGRSDLKNSFSKGSLPTAAHFRQLIDSMLNLQDDDYQELLTEMGGPLKLFVNEKQKDEKEVLIRFFKSKDELKGDSVWRFVLSKSEEELDTLELLNEKGDTILQLCQNGEVKINAKKLHLGGQVFQSESIGSFVGTNKTHQVPANGKWHPILDGLKGCQMFDIVACAGNESTQSKNYSMIRSTASLIPVNRGLMNFLFPDRSRIHTIHSHAGSNRNKIDLKWIREGDKASLNIRTRSDFKGSNTIFYRIKRVWADELMHEEDKAL